MQRPCRISEMRPCHSAQISTARGNNTVGMVGFENRTHRHRRNLCFIADTIRKRCLEHPSKYRLLRFTTCPDEQSIRSAPAALNNLAISTASSGVIPPSTQSCAEIRTEIGLLSGHTARIAEKTSKGKRQRFSNVPPYSS